jgi:hypothetical protein
MPLPLLIDSCVPGTGSKVSVAWIAAGLGLTPASLRRACPRRSPAAGALHCFVHQAAAGGAGFAGGGLAGMVVSSGCAACVFSTSNQAGHGFLLAWAKHKT